jgi:hypothetical protein
LAVASCGHRRLGRHPLWVVPLPSLEATAAVASVVEKREVEVCREESHREGVVTEKREREGLLGCARVWGPYILSRVFASRSVLYF